MPGDRSSLLTSRSWGGGGVGGGQRKSNEWARGHRHGANTYVLSTDSHSHRVIEVCTLSNHHGSKFPRRVGSLPLIKEPECRPVLVQVQPNVPHPLLLTKHIVRRNLLQKISSGKSRSRTAQHCLWTTTSADQVQSVFHTTRPSWVTADDLETQDGE